MEGIKPKHNVIPNNERIKEFSSEIEYEGLPYIFKGKINEKAKDVWLGLYIPEWKEEVSKINELVRPPSDLVRHGEIGYVSAHRADRNQADLYIQRIRSHTEWLPKGSKYNFENVHVGRFLMDNLLALADKNGWRVTAVAGTDGRLSNEDVYDWLERRGFSSPWEGEPVRQPKEPDMSQPIMKILE